MTKACEACELHLEQEVKNVCLPAKGNPQSGLFVVFDRPNKSEDDRGMPFSGTASRLFMDLIEKAKIPFPDGCYLTYSTKCYLPDGAAKAMKSVSAEICKKTWLEKEILKFKPSVVVAVGGDSMEAISGLTGVMKNRGTFIDVTLEDHKFKMMSTLSPAYLMNNHRELEGQVILDLKRAYNGVHNGVTCWTPGKEKDLDYHVVKTFKDFMNMYDEISNAGVVTCDIECRGKDPYFLTFPSSGFPLVSIQFSTHAGSGWFLPIAHESFVGETNPEGMAWRGGEWQSIKAALKLIFETGDIFVIGHNFKFDSKWILKHLGIKPKLSFDTMLAHGLFGETSSSLKKLAWEMTDIGGYEEEQSKYTDSLDPDKKWDMFHYPFDQLATYGCCDVDATFRVFEILDKKLRDHPQMMALFKILIKASRAFLDIEHEGIKIDTAYLKQLEIDLTLDLAKLKEDFKLAAAKEIEAFNARLLAEATSAKTGKILKNKQTEFNIDSSDHVSELFYDILGFPINDRHRSKKTKDPSVGKKALEELAGKHPIAKILMEYRGLSKQKVGFVDAYPRYTDAFDRIHPDYKLIKFYNEDADKEQGTSTGRLACSDPNLQQVPSRDEDKRIKKLFIPDYDNHLLMDCLVPGTRVLTSDFQWKNIEDFKVGDELVGFDETLDKNTKLRKSIVEKIGKRKAKTITVITDKGSVTCSDNHMWAAYKQYDGCYGKRQWIKTKDLKEGMKISYLCSPWKTEDTFESGWMSGMFEGEGWVNKRGGCGIAQNPGDVLDRIEEQLEKDGFTYTKRIQEGHKCVQLVLTGPYVPMRAIGKYKIKRLLDKYEFEGMRGWSRQTASATILKVCPIEGEETVISMKTSTRTFIAEGLFSHNCDYSGIELRVTAMYCQDPIMKQFFNTGKGDFHRHVASKVYGKPEDQITKLERTYAKATTFGILYGAGPAKIAEQAKCSISQAQEFIEEYFKLFPTLKKWIFQQKAFAQKNFYVKSLFGRIRPLPDAGSYNEGLREQALRRAVNTPIQSDASDITLYGLTRIATYLNKFKHADASRPSRLRASVHDSILISAHNDDFAEIAEHIKFDILEKIDLDFISNLGVHLAAEVSVGPTWGQQTNLETEE